MVSIAERIAACLPGASFELESLVRLVGVVETTEVPSAAVTVSERARLLVNPDSSRLTADGTSTCSCW